MPEPRSDEGSLGGGRLLNGRVYYQQPARPYRTGIEPVILAAAVPARSGEFVVEFGCGAGAGLLCIAARVPNVCGLGVEIQSDLAGWAQSNIEANAFGDRLSVIVGDVMDVLPDRQVDHAFANPPWHDEFSSRSAMPGRDVARRREAGLVESWARAMTRRLRHRGTVTLILPASCVHVGLAALAGSGCGAVALYPLWPKPHKPARIILLQGIYRARGADRILPGLVVHAPQEGYTPEAEAILRGGDALDLGR